MKKKEFEELKTKSVSALGEILQEKLKEKTNILLELKMGKLKNVHQAKTLKKDIAKIKTLILIKAFQVDEKTSVSKTVKSEAKHAAS